MKKGKRGQASLEYAMIVGLMMLVTVPVFYYANAKVSNDLSLTKVDDAVTSLTAAADTVYLSGPGTVKLVWIDLPGGVTSTEVSGRHVSVKFNVNGQETEIHGLSKAELTGSVPDSQGTYRMKVEMLDSGTVSISR